MSDSADRGAEEADGASLAKRGASSVGGARYLSKSKLLAFRQCERRLWLEVHHPEWRADSVSAQARFNIGHQVGDLARQQYDPDGRGVLIDAQAEGFANALQRTEALLKTPQPIFEAGFAAAGALAFADVMLPVDVDGQRMWRVVEVKSSTSVKDHHRDDVAVQAFVARQGGVPLASIALAHVDSDWVYPGDGNYSGLLKEEDLTADAFAKGAQVQAWINDAQVVVAQTSEPQRATGAHCGSPFECGFFDHCRAGEPQAEFPVAWLPRVQTKALKTHLSQPGVIDMRDVPDSLLNAKQQRVKAQTVNGSAWFDSAGAAKALKKYRAPHYFLDFETIQFAVPIWAGTRPYEQIPFQFSMHHLLSTGGLEHREFLDLSGGNPSAAFVSALLEVCGTSGPVFVYNAGFERGRMKELATRFPRSRAALQALAARVVDLLPIAQAHYYDPSQQGSWSIKKVLPAVVPELRYDMLDGVQDGGAVMNAYAEGISPTTTVERRDEVRKQLLQYCCLDTYAMVRLWQVFAGRQDLQL